LAVVYGIVAQAGGHVELTSAPGRGTAVEIWWPLETGDARPGPQAGSGVPAVTGRILVVDDDEGVRELTRRMLVRCGLEVATARDAASAMRILEDDDQIVLMLADVIMPGTSGPDLAEQARRLRPLLPVLFVSGYPQDIDMLDHAGLDNTAFLEKPFRESQLLDAVRLMLETG
jgi:DNA-binding NtrC family response regulator